MINTKTNTNQKFIYILFIFLGLYGCDNKESFTFVKQNFTTDTLINCRNTDCALLEINLLKTVEGNINAKNINKEIETVACNILNIDKNTPEPNLKKAIEQFNNSYQAIINEYPDETVPYEANIDCEIDFQGKNVISLIMDFYVFTGGAHGYGGIIYLNIDKKTGERFSNERLFKDYKKFKEYAEKVFRSKNEIAQNESINSTGFFFEDDVFRLPENIGFTDTDVILYYNPYEISSYAEGPIKIKLNKEEVALFFAIEIF
ncbi:DUF3298 and DUF4163 domain-containing protein [Aquimarina muelleri]|uniref:DUF3298/DUF4163 domain-containing protein n=1 Tax=Aquimarina muelleri TaxID=279356 RepID=A0A918N1L4_9FLAO|nr:DUF3298 and DUF4163 domain-containing protein [Aquimarina muelleri]MCX2762797.1 DUF3298 and DUF4163 domain-containing protein [Aquimarina muelleri]GGX11889.1 hypothetical protein GCM10007384_12000 [Aquimarina muelleri]